MIAVDWGTSNFRAYRLDQEGQILDRRFSPMGVLRVEKGRFAETLQASIGDWIAAGERHVLMSGMVGSRQGWAEAKYLSCPAGIDDLARGVVEVPFSGVQVRLVPGVMGQDSHGIPEVMRGEETETMGVLDAHGGSGLVCMPGTHSKWIQLHNRSIVSFMTCMTGEVYAALRKHTILSSFMRPDAEVDREAFHQGVARSADSGGLLHHLFSVRTLALAGQLNEKTSASYLSGLLIGHEVRSVMPAGEDVQLVGAAHLCALYLQAIEACGGQASCQDEDSAARGLAAIGRRLSWL